MPVVRELVNRISFKIDPADKKNAEAAINKMDKGAERVIKNAKKIGKAFAASIAALTVASTKLFVDFEKDTGASAFFARNKKQAEELNKLLDQVAERSETTSRREARRASKTLAQTTLTQKQIKDFIPFLEKISVARPDLDFTAVAENFKDVIAGGDLDKLAELVPGFKDTAELLQKTTFQSPFGDITQVQRGEILLAALLKAQPKLNELAKEQQETLNFQFSALAKQASDFTLNFGETTAPAIKEALSILTDLIKQLNESKVFWDTLESVVLSVKNTLKSVSDFFGEEEDPERTKNLNESFQRSLKERGIKQASFSERTENLIGRMFALKPPAKNFLRDQENTVTVNGEIILKNESGEKVGVLSEDAMRQFEERFKGSLNNISASNGALVGVD